MPDETLWFENSDQEKRSWEASHLILISAPSRGYRSVIQGEFFNRENFIVVFDGENYCRSNESFLVTVLPYLRIRLSTFSDAFRADQVLLGCLISSPILYIEPLSMDFTSCIRQWSVASYRYGYENKEEGR